VDKHLSLPSLYGYRLAIGYFRGDERVVRAHRAFVLSLGVTVTVTVWDFVLGFLYEKSSLSWLAGHWGRLQPRSPVELRRRPVM